MTRNIGENASHTGGEKKPSEKKHQGVTCKTFKSRVCSRADHLRTHTVICSKTSEEWKLEADKSEYLAGPAVVCAATWIRNVEFSWEYSKSSMSSSGLDVSSMSSMFVGVCIPTSCGKINLSC